MNPFRINVVCLLLLLVVLLGTGGCAPPSKAPAGFGVVREHMLSAPHNVPPIYSLLDFTIIEVDGAPAKRERPPLFVDMQPGALVSAGTHRFMARTTPHLIPPGYRPREVTFEASVESEKIYWLVDDKNGGPVLIEDHPDSR